MENAFDSEDLSLMKSKLKSRKRLRIQCWSDEQCEKIKVLKPSCEAKSTQTDDSNLELLSASIRLNLCDTVKSKLERNLDCGICKEIYLDSCILPCGHIFCSYCIRMWFLHADTCPICRITTEFVIGTKIIDNFLKDLLITFDNDSIEQRETMVTDRKAVLQKVETNWVYQNSSSVYTSPEMWQDWLNLQTNNTEVLNTANPPDIGSQVDSEDRTANNLWPWESDEPFAVYTSADVSGLYLPNGDLAVDIDDQPE